MDKSRNYTVIRKMFTPEFLDQFNVDLEELVRVNGFKDEDVFRCTDPLTQKMVVKQIQNLHHYPIYKDFAKTLISYRSQVIIKNVQYFVKHPNYKITSPHQDGAYFNDPSKKIFTYWIPLQDVNKDTSCLHYLNDSHSPLQSILEHKKVGTTVRTRTGTTGYSQYCDLYPESEYVPVEMSKGDVLIHDQFALHYASKNEGNEKRVALTCIMEIR